MGVLILGPSEVLALVLHVPLCSSAAAVAVCAGVYSDRPFFYAFVSAWCKVLTLAAGCMMAVMGVSQELLWGVVAA